MVSPGIKSLALSMVTVKVVARSSVLSSASLFAAIESSVVLIGGGGRYTRLRGCPLLQIRRVGRRSRLRPGYKFLYASVLLFALGLKWRRRR